MHLIFKGSKPFVSDNFDNSFSPGGRILLIFFREGQNSLPMPDRPPPPELDTDRCITTVTQHFQKKVIELKHEMEVSKSTAAE